MALKTVIIVVLVASSLISTTFAVKGTATFYTDYVPSACYGNQDEGTMIAAANPKMFNNGAICGTICKVRCIGGTNQTPHPCKKGSIKVKIVDLCPGCGNNQLDLSYEAFSAIANPDAGKVRIKFDC